MASAAASVVVRARARRGAHAAEQSSWVGGCCDRGAARGYLGYFENKFGEQLVFVHDDGGSDATVLLGDVCWEPRRVSDTGGLPDAGDLILNDEERAFVKLVGSRQLGMPRPSACCSVAWSPRSAGSTGR